MNYAVTVDFPLLYLGNLKMFDYRRLQISSLQ